ncbi:MAG TPA: VapC toxin family PIN domain ribonuclease [Rubrivivax sp.]|nr:VapC toxin family PIN domain ribonuclease [Rubrivivax sp.]
MQNLHLGWASCPLTQNGCIRVMSQPAYPNGAPPGRIANRLREAMQVPAHEFWPDDVDGVASTALNWTVILGSRQLTDAYLLALAVRRGGRFVTLDRGVPLAAVEGAQPQALVVLD